ncbi:ABC transporter ATP-binding protein [Nocardioides marmoriginsengisoli]|uniref:ABC transporter ATP-binding protein n=1 Tax=Nocardioides marmoriginsengisoli TaxID=661483 RepID=A0A3N0CBL8_9ACTN|nr:ABC transporter ATP-binding protein [Nocardioides marmoriginsengisoli]
MRRPVEHPRRGDERERRRPALPAPRRRPDRTGAAVHGDDAVDRAEGRPAGPQPLHRVRRAHRPLLRLGDPGRRRSPGARRGRGDRRRGPGDPGSRPGRRPARSPGDGGSVTGYAAELLDVSVAYATDSESVLALNSVSFACRPASSTSIVGRSGSGKSTLISVLSLLREPTVGKVLLDGEDAALMSDANRSVLRSARIGIVFQAFHLEPSLTVLQNVMLGWNFRHAGLSRSQAVARATDDLDSLGIADLAGRRPNALSGGQRQRVAIARAVFARPTLLVADEPTGNLDEETAGAVAEKLLALPGQYGTAVVIVTHDQAIARLADTRLELVRGRIRDARA